MSSRCAKCGRSLCIDGTCAVCSATPSADELAQRLRERRVAFRASLPAGFQWARFGTELLAQRVSSADAIDRVRALSPDTLIQTHTGPSGAGKTSLAVARGDQLVELGRDPLFVSAIELAEAHRERKYGEPFAELLKAQRADVLILDDLGSEPSSSADPLVTLIHHRHAAERPTIVTTGLRSAALEERYGSGVVRRLTERDRAVVVACGAWTEPQR